MLRPSAPSVDMVTATSVTVKWKKAGVFTGCNRPSSFVLKAADVASGDADVAITSTTASNSHNTQYAISVARRSFGMKRAPLRWERVYVSVFLLADRVPFCSLQASRINKNAHRLDKIPGVKYAHSHLDRHTPYVFDFLTPARDVAVSLRTQRPFILPPERHRRPQ